MNSIVKNITDLSGYHFPFEGEKHLATCLLVPYREDTWRDNAKPAMKEYLSIVKAIMESHHRECGAKNRENGVEFWFELDRDCANNS